MIVRGVIGDARVFHQTLLDGDADVVFGEQVLQFFESLRKKGFVNLWSTGFISCNRSSRRKNSFSEEINFNAWWGKWNRWLSRRADHFSQPRNSWLVLVGGKIQAQRDALCLRLTSNPIYLHGKQTMGIQMRMPVFFFLLSLSAFVVRRKPVNIGIIVVSVMVLNVKINVILDCCKFSRRLNWVAKCSLLKYLNRNLQLWF